MEQYVAIIVEEPTSDLNLIQTLHRSSELNNGTSENRNREKKKEKIMYSLQPRDMILISRS